MFNKCKVFAEKEREREREQEIKGRKKGGKKEGKGNNWLETIKLFCVSFLSKTP